MRCKFCGSESIRQDTDHKNFSTVKAVAGAVAFGIVGAVTGFIGKDIKGYRCGACGAFMDAPMDFSTEFSIKTAIEDAEAGKDRSMYDYYKRQYINISANVPVQTTTVNALPQQVIEANQTTNYIYESKVSVPNLKRVILNNKWEPDTPINIEELLISTVNENDSLSLVATNQTDKVIRSIYLTVQVMDDTGDIIGTETCVYQGVSCESGAKLPEDKTFSLNTSLAYSIDVRVDKVAFEDGDVWRNEDVEPIIIVPQVTLSEENFSRLKQLRREFSMPKQKRNFAEEMTVYMPASYDTHWQCACGKPVKNGCDCYWCGETKEHLDKIFDLQYLEEQQKNYVRKKAEDRYAVSSKIYNEAEKEIAELKAKAEKDEIERKNKIYFTASTYQVKDKISDLESAIKEFSKIPGWQDADDRLKASQKRLGELKAEAARIAEEERKEGIYSKAESLKGENSISSLETAIKQYESIKNHKDAGEKIDYCKKRIEEITLENKKIAKKKKIATTIVSIAVCIVIAFLVVLFVFIIPNNKFDEAMGYLKNNDFDTAYSMLEELGTHNNADEVIQQSKYDRAIALVEDKKYEEAIELFNQINDFKDASAKSKETMISNAARYEAAGDTANAIKWYATAGDKNKVNENKYLYVSQHKNSTDKTTYEYLLALKSEQYKDAKDIYSQLYKLSAKIIFNTDENDTSSNLDAYYRVYDYEDEVYHNLPTIYYHYTVNGGPPIETINVKVTYEVSYRNKTPNYSIESENTEEIKSGVSQLGYIKSSTGNSYWHRVTVYNADTGEMLAQETLRTTYKNGPLVNFR